MDVTLPTAKQSIDHYGENYFVEHYSHLLGDPNYYRLLASYWARIILDPISAFGLSAASRFLDYGCGTGVVSAELSNAAAYDSASYACALLRSLGREVFDQADAIPADGFDAILCSHSLEHYPNPAETLEKFKHYVRRPGFVVLLLPIESDFTPTIHPDNNQHLFCWTFQTISNLLLLCGWQPLLAQTVYGPFLLRTIARWLRPSAAVELARKLGRIKRGFPSMLVLARISS